MCGIVASINAPPLHIKTLEHRGPNASGMHHLTINHGKIPVYLGMTRLAITDQGAVETPFYCPYSKVHVAFNGEIYNYQELRAELSDGMPWLTNCDTEVVARAWRRWGVDAWRRFNGMWALVLADELEDCVVVCRDRAGEKPLYTNNLAIDTGSIQWLLASEIKAFSGAIPLEMNWNCDDYDTLEFDCRSETLFKGVTAFEPGTCMVLRNGSIKLSRWWAFPEKPKYPENQTAIFIHKNAKEGLRELLIDAVKIRANTEVPLGIQLSGGLDSAIVQAIAKRESIYTVTFDEPGFDNLALAKKAAQGFEPRPVTFTLADVEEAFPSIAYHLDTPATWTAVCQWFLFKKMSEDGIKVTLSGEGSDELFLGYSRYKVLDWIDQGMRDPVLKNYGPTWERLVGSDIEIIAKLLNRDPDSYLRVGHSIKLVDQYGGEGHLAERLARTEWHTTMQVLLRMPDRMSAAFSMENRAPFLDYRIIELAARMPYLYKINESWTKAILREVALDLGVPKEIAWDSNKRGLALPWNVWNKKEGWDRTSFTNRMRKEWRKVFNF